MKVLLFGGRGYIGGWFRQIFPDAVLSSVDTADACGVAESLDREKPDIVINTAAKTGRPNIDWCEDHKQETIHSNVRGPLVLLEECAKCNVYWVHLSSGCIYQGDNNGKGFSEEDPPNFFGSFYSQTKAWADQILKEFPVLILRLRMPFDDTLHERNLISKLLEYRRVLDVKNSLTYLPDFIDIAHSLIKKRRTGVFNIVNPGSISPYEIMNMYKKFVQKNHIFERLTLAQLSEVAKAGRSNCVLSTEKLQKAGIILPDVCQRLEEVMRKLSITTARP